MALTHLLRRDVQRLIDKGVGGIRPIRQVTVPLTDIIVGTTTVNVSWTPGLHGRYGAVVTVLPGAGVLGALHVAVNPQTLSNLGCDITVRNTGLVTLSGTAHLTLVPL